MGVSSGHGNGAAVPTDRIVAAPTRVAVGLGEPAGQGRVPARMGDRRHRTPLQPERAGGPMRPLPHPTVRLRRRHGSVPATSSPRGAAFGSIGLIRSVGQPIRVPAEVACADCRTRCAISRLRKRPPSPSRAPTTTTRWAVRGAHPHVDGARSASTCGGPARTANAVVPGGTDLVITGRARICGRDGADQVRCLPSKPLPTPGRPRDDVRLRRVVEAPAERDQRWLGCSPHRPTWSSAPGESP